MWNNGKLKAIGLLFISLLLVTACGQLSQPNVNAPNSSTKDAKKEQPAAKSAVQANSNQSPSVSGNNQPEDWQKVVEAAKQEGKVTVSAQPSEAWRRALTEPFEKKYPAIKVEYTGANSRDFWPKLYQERKVDKYLWDIRVNGADLAYKAKNEGILVPIRSLLLPEIADDKKWLGGVDGLFADNEKKYIAAFLAYSSSQIDVNRDFISEAELSSPEQLLDPKFKGKIVLQEPISGSGLGAMAILLHVYGEQFVKDLLTKQDVMITSDNRQQVEWVVRGRYPIGIGLAEAQVQVFLKQGLGKNIKSLEKGPIAISSGVGAIQLFTNAPHPNASNVYLNWLLSQEAQAEIAEAVELNSRRLDAAPGNKERVVDPLQINRFVDHQSEPFRPIRLRIPDLLKELNLAK